MLSQSIRFGEICNDTLHEFRFRDHGRQVSLHIASVPERSVSPRTRIDSDCCISPNSPTLQDIIASPRLLLEAVNGRVIRPN